MAQTSCSLLAEFGCATGKVGPTVPRNKCKRAVPTQTEVLESSCFSGTAPGPLPVASGQEGNANSKEKLGHFRAKQFFSKSSVLTLKNKEGII